jgi:hypothetical protein
MSKATRRWALTVDGVYQNTDDMYTTVISLETVNTTITRRQNIRMINDEALRLAHQIFLQHGVSHDKNWGNFFDEYGNRVGWR